MLPLLLVLTLLDFRNRLHKANKKLSQVLVDVLKTTAAAEETIGLHMQSLRDAQRVNTKPISASAAGK